MKPARSARIWMALVLILMGAGSAVADPFSSSPFGNGSGYAPTVPVSAFARPAAWFDPSRLHISTLISVGSAWGGRGTDGLQLTSLTYQFAAPLSLRVGVGNAFGASRAVNGHGMFLEGLELAYRPHPSFQINVQYQDVRSPLQLSASPGYHTLGR